MFDQELFLDFFIALFALLNPLLAIPVFLGLTGNFSVVQRQRTAAVASLTTAIALIVAALVGDRLLALLAINVPSFQIAGGLIVLSVAFAMLKQDTDEKPLPDEANRDAVSQGGGIAIYPLAIPLLAGPGAFVTTIVFSSRVDTLGDLAAICAAIAATALVLWLAMAFATAAGRFLNQTAISIGTKILGILLAAISVEMIIAGIDAHFIPLFGNS